MVFLETRLYNPVHHIVIHRHGTGMGTSLASWDMVFNIASYFQNCTVIRTGLDYNRLAQHTLYQCMCNADLPTFRFQKLYFLQAIFGVFFTCSIARECLSVAICLLAIISTSVTHTKINIAQRTKADIIRLFAER